MSCDYISKNRDLNSPGIFATIVQMIISCHRPHLLIMLLFAQTLPPRFP
jgi:hypothetical protein